MTRKVSARTLPGWGSDMALQNTPFLMALLRLPGVVKPTLFDDMQSYFWLEESIHDPLYIEHLTAAQRVGIYPDLDHRLVRFNAGLLTRAYPELRPYFIDLQNLRPLTFNGVLPGRPRPQLRVLEGGLSHLIPQQQEAV